MNRQTAIGLGLAAAGGVAYYFLFASGGSGGNSGYDPKACANSKAVNSASGVDKAWQAMKSVLSGDDCDHPSCCDPETADPAHAAKASAISSAMKIGADVTQRVESAVPGLTAAQINGIGEAWSSYLSSHGFDESVMEERVFEGKMTNDEFTKQEQSYMDAFVAAEKATFDALANQVTQFDTAQAANSKSIAALEKSGELDKMLQRAADKAGYTKWWGKQQSDGAKYIIANNKGNWATIQGLINYAVSQMSQGATAAPFCYGPPGQIPGTPLCGKISYWPDCSDSAATAANGGQCNPSDPKDYY